VSLKTAAQIGDVVELQMAMGPKSVASFFVVSYSNPHGATSTFRWKDEDARWFKRFFLTK
jgi:hypothetical protein